MNIKNLRIFILLLGIGLFINGFNEIFQYQSDLSELDQISEEIPFQKGMSFTTWSDYSFNKSWVKDEFLKMKAIGVEWLAINHWWWQDYLNSTEIKSAQWSDSSENMTACFLYAKSIGLHIMYKPMLNLLMTYDWRSYIIFSPDWMGNYTAWLVEQAHAAEAGSVEILCIGTEMGNMQVHSAEMRNMIAQIRSVFSGKITYSANHDSFIHIDWYDAIDIIGISMYSMMTTAWNPSVSELTQVWNGMYLELEELALKWNKPVMFTETGIQATDGSNLIPNDNQISREKDLSEMRNYYLSLFKSNIWTASWFKGAYWWIWDRAQAENTELKDFNPVLIQDTIQEEYQKDHQVDSSNLTLLKVSIPLFLGLISFVLLIINTKNQPIFFEKTPNSETISLDGKKYIPNSKPLQEILIGLILGSLFSIVASSYQLKIFNVVRKSVTYAIILQTSLTETLLTFGGIFFLSLMTGLLLLRYVPKGLPIASFFSIIFSSYNSLRGYQQNVYLQTYFELVSCFCIISLLILAKLKMRSPGILTVLLTSLVVICPYFILLSYFDGLTPVFLTIPLGLVLILIPKINSIKNLAHTSDLLLPTSNEKPSRKIPRFELMMLINSLFVGALIPFGNTILNLIMMNTLNIAAAYIPAVIGGIGVSIIFYIVNKKPGGISKFQKISWFSNYILLITCIGITLIGFLYLLTGSFIPIWGIISGILLLILLGTWSQSLNNAITEKTLGRSFLYLTLIASFFVLGFILNGIKGLLVYTMTFLVFKDGQILRRDPLLDPVAQFDVPFLLNSFVLGIVVILGLVMLIYKLFSNKIRKTRV